MSATDPQSLLAQAQCYVCLGISMAEALQLALLAQVVNSSGGGGGNTITPAQQALLDRRYGRVLASNVNAVLSPVAPTSIYSFAVPANTFVNNGDHVHLNSALVVNAAETLLLSYRVNGLQQVSIVIDNTNDDFDGNSFELGFEVIKSSATNLILNGFFAGTATPPAGGSAAHSEYWNASLVIPVDFTQPITLSIIANSINLGDFTFIGANIEFNPSP